METNLNNLPSLQHSIQEPVPPSSPVSQHQQAPVIYGTSISIEQTCLTLESFILNFETTIMDQGQPVKECIYRVKLADLEHSDLPVLTISAQHLSAYDHVLYLQLIFHPAEMIALFDQALQNIYQKYFIDSENDQTTKSEMISKKSQFKIGIQKLSQEDMQKISSLNATHIFRLLYLQGLVVRCSDIYPQLKTACFRCQACRETVNVDLVNARVQEPTHCLKCKRKNTLFIEHNLSQYTNKQYVKVQELPQNVADGLTPSSIQVITYDHNVDAIGPGDRVEIIGIYRVRQQPIQRNKNQVKSLFRTYVDVISISKIQDENRMRENVKLTFSDHDRHLFFKMAAKKTIQKDLINSMSPSIYGHHQIKKGLLAQLLGGTTKQLGVRGRCRSDINICLVGDPSTAKSQFLQQVHRIAPRGIYTSGRGSSGVGLTASVKKDPQNKEFVLQSGALVLSDQGICCIDEFDKMNKEARAILLEAMQQQTISIAKAGIVCQLNCRTSILAAANPISSKYDTKKSVIENINLPSNLLSRFDLIYLMLDIPTQTYDSQVAKHILQFYLPAKKKREKEGPYSRQTLTKYITFAKTYIHPQISAQAGQRLMKSYSEMRQQGLTSKTITATPRQLESMIRLSQAFARMRLSEIVTVNDVDEARQLIEEATMAAATDPETGLIDMNILTSGQSVSRKAAIEELAASIKVILLGRQSRYKDISTIEMLEQDLRRSLKKEFNSDHIAYALRQLQGQDFIDLFGAGRSHPQFRLRNYGDLD